ncbi:MAG: indole-3-glycerol phosphate synthase TrpC [Ferruginibacter sp.]
MHILDTIIAHKYEAVATRKTIVPVSKLEQSVYFNRPTISLKASLLDDTKNGIIAEFKRQSPSKGIINNTADVIKVTEAYTTLGASGLSILTDEHFFGGKAEDVMAARIHSIPILRKDFIVDEYQILEAKAMGADVILLIAACLSKERVATLAAFAQSLQLEVLLELHGDEELNHITDDIALIGVNNRDLQTFTVDINRSIALSEHIPKDKIKIAESGIHDVQTICTFRNAGFKGFLIGENFMKAADPAIAFAEFTQQLKAALS